MANLKGKIEDVVIGTHYSVSRTLDNVGAGQYLKLAYLTIKEEYWDTDTAAVFQKSISPVYVAGQGHIQDTGETDGVAVIRFDLTPEDTILLREYFTYFYDIKVVTDADNDYIPEFGTIIPQPRVTRTGEPV